MSGDAVVEDLVIRSISQAEKEADDGIYNDEDLVRVAFRTMLVDVIKVFGQGRAALSAYLRDLLDTLTT